MQKFPATAIAALLISMSLLAVPAQAGDVKRGRSIFHAKCQACHGLEGDAGHKGGMKNAANFARLDANNPRIRSLLANLSEEDHKKIVRMGGGKSGVPGAGAAMPRLGIPEDEIDDVVAYERTLGAFATRSSQPASAVSAAPQKKGATR